MALVLNGYASLMCGMGWFTTWNRAEVGACMQALACSLLFGYSVVPIVSNMLMSASAC